MFNRTKTRSALTHQAILLLACLIAGLLMLSACQPAADAPAASSTVQQATDDDQDNADADQSMPDSQASTGSSKEATNQTDSDTESGSDMDDIQQPEGDAGSFSEANLQIKVNGQSFQMFEDAAPLLAILGDDYNYSEADSCVFDGMDKTFDYGDVLVYTIPSGDTDLLDGFDILGGDFETDLGIKIGSGKNEIMGAYGEPADDTYEILYNVSGDAESVGEPRLTFYLNESDEVEYISYYSGSNAK